MASDCLCFSTPLFPFVSSFRFRFRFALGCSICLWVASWRHETTGELYNRMKGTLPQAHSEREKRRTVWLRNEDICLTSQLRSMFVFLEHILKYFINVRGIPPYFITARKLPPYFAVTGTATPLRQIDILHRLCPPKNMVPRNTLKIIQWWVLRNSGGVFRQD